MPDLKTALSHLHHLLKHVKPPRGGMCSAALSVALVSSCVLAGPEIRSATMRAEGAGGPVGLALDGPVFVDARRLDQTRVVFRVVFDEPLLAYRRVEPIGCEILDVTINADGSLRVQADGIEPSTVFGVSIVDAAGATGVTAWSQVLAGQHTGDFEGDNDHDIADIVRFVMLFEAGDDLADVNVNGLLDGGDVTGFVQGVLAGGQIAAVTPSVSPIGDAYVPSGGVGRPVEFDVRLPVDFASGVPIGTEIEAIADDPTLLEESGVGVMRDGDRVSVALSGRAGATGSTGVRVLVRDGAGGEILAESSFTAFVRPDGPPTARAFAVPFLGEAPLAVEFDATETTDTLRNVATYQWDFGDGQSGEGPVVSHAYAVPGEYAAVLTVTDDSGMTDTIRRVITVAEPGFDAGSVEIDELEARRFLWQAAFGPSEADVAYVMSEGFEAWIDMQMSLPPSLFDYQRYVDAQDAGLVSNISIERFFDDHAILGADQLRQRTAWALIQLIVMNSVQNGPDNEADMLYYNRYVEGAFGGYCDLLEFVSFSYQMGVYLTFSESSAAGMDGAAAPDENYAREMLQLFTIGLHQTDGQGRELRDVYGELIPTYATPEIEQFARAFTGLRRTGQDQRLPMTPELEARELGDKALLDYEGSVPEGGYIPANPTATEQDVIDEVGLAIANAFWHPNCPPFVAERLIQRFVTSNPTPAYIGRVADAFRGEGPYGSGERGDLGAAIKAVLLDAEARDPAYRTNPSYGRVMEPFVTGLGLKRWAGTVENPGNPPMLDQIDLNTNKNMGKYRQGFMESPSVFNFYLSDYAPPDTGVEHGGLASPELQIHTSITAFAAPNAWMQDALAEGFDSAYMDGVAAAAGYQAEAIVDRLIADLAHGPISAETRAILIDTVEQVASERNGVRAAVRLLLASPEFVVLQ